MAVSGGKWSQEESVLPTGQLRRPETGPGGEQWPLEVIAAMALPLTSRESRLSGLSSATWEPTFFCSPALRDERFQRQGCPGPAASSCDHTEHGVGRSGDADSFAPGGAPIRPALPPGAKVREGELFPPQFFLFSLSLSCLSVDTALGSRILWSSLKPGSHPRPPACGLCDSDRHSSQ